MFPMIRLFSSRLTPLFLKLGLSANQLTMASLTFGIFACIAFISESKSSNLLGALLFFICYILDNCDGEVARAQAKTSAFGDKLDTFVDWVVHGCFFSAIGYQSFNRTEDPIWVYLGLISAIGCTINYLIVTFYAGSSSKMRIVSENKTQRKENDFLKNTIFVFREMFRDDFCFIVLILALFDLIWLLLPVAVIGTHVYWIMLLIKLRFRG